MEIAGARVLLTGASGGLGQAIARALAQRGGHLVLTGRRTQELADLAQELGGSAIAADLSRHSEIERLIAAAGEFDILVANAGLSAALRADLHRSGVGSSCIFPGFIREAGIFAEAEVKLPPGVGTRSPQDVGQAVVEAVERDRGEVDVAPLVQRGGAVLGSLFPDLNARAIRTLGGTAIAVQMEERLRFKR
jgi:short-subunit dehydrogenase